MHVPVYRFQSRVMVALRWVNFTQRAYEACRVLSYFWPRVPPQGNAAGGVDSYLPGETDLVLFLNSVPNHCSCQIRGVAQLV